MVEDLFGAPVSVYTDEDAVADGTLVDVSSWGLAFRNGRALLYVTRGLFEQLVECLPCEKWVDAGQYEALSHEAVKELKAVFRTKIGAAAPFDGEDPANVTSWKLPGGAAGLWAMQNGSPTGGYTLMRPEDY